MQNFLSCGNIVLRSTGGSFTFLSSSACGAPKVLAAVLCLLIASATLSAQTTVFEANFNSDTNGSSGASPDAWSASTASGCASMSITSNRWQFQTGNQGWCTGQTAVWTSAVIDISNLTDLSISYTTGGASSTVAVSMTNGSLDGTNFTPSGARRQRRFLLQSLSMQRVRLDGLTMWC